MTRRFGVFSVIFLILYTTSGKQLPSTEYLKELDYDVKCKMQANSLYCSTSYNASNEYRYFYDIKMQACRGFQFYDCGVSLNNFLSLSECYYNCKDAGIKRIFSNKTIVFCHLQPDFGECFEYHPRYYYDINSKSCQGFSYSGCGGNNNRFNSVVNCVSTCSHAITMMDY